MQGKVYVLWNILNQVSLIVLYTFITIIINQITVLISQVQKQKKFYFIFILQTTKNKSISHPECPPPRRGFQQRYDEHTAACKCYKPPKNCFHSPDWTRGSIHPPNCTTNHRKNKPTWLFYVLHQQNCLIKMVTAEHRCMNLKEWEQG